MLYYTCTYAYVSMYLILNCIIHTHMHMYPNTVLYIHICLCITYHTLESKIAYFGASLEKRRSIPVCVHSIPVCVQDFGQNRESVGFTFAAVWIIIICFQNALCKHETHLASHNHLQLKRNKEL